VRQDDFEAIFGDGRTVAALREEEIDCILIGAMAAIEQGAPLMTVDYDLWVKLAMREQLPFATQDPPLRSAARKCGVRLLLK